MDLELTANRVHATAVDKGFWGDPVLLDKVMAKLMLVTSELTEILEAIRKNKGLYATTEEFCDAHIRLLDLYVFCTQNGLCSVGLEDLMHAKMDMNDSRPALHGHKWG